MIWFATVVRKRRYQDFQIVASSQNDAIDLIFLEAGFSRNEIVICRPMNEHEDIRRDLFIVPSEDNYRTVET